MKHEDDLRYKPKDYLCSWQQVAVAVVAAVASAAAQRAFAKDPPEVETSGDTPQTAEQRATESSAARRKRLSMEAESQGPKRDKLGSPSGSKRSPSLTSSGDGTIA